MEEDIRKNEILKAITNIEYYPINQKNEDVSIEKYAKIPFEKISALGIAFEPLTAAFQSIFLGGGGNGIYFVNTRGLGELAKFRNRPGFLSTIMKNNTIAGQASLTPLACNPTMLFMAISLMSIEKKLERIQETQKQIIEFLEQKEKAKLRGNLIFLTDVLNSYKHNWMNEKYKSSNHIKVLDIRQDAEQSILFYQERIGKQTKKQSFFFGDKNVTEKLKKIQSEFKEYQLALYLYSFASFLEVMLLENFESAYLDSVVNKIDDYAYQYRELYNECYDQLEGNAKTSFQSHLLSGLATINKAAGEAIAKIPIVSNSQIDETLIEAGSRLENFGSRRTAETMEQLLDSEDSSVRPFIDNINIINVLYNQPMDLLFDKENVYFRLPNS